MVNFKLFLDSGKCSLSRLNAPPQSVTKLKTRIDIAQVRIPQEDTFSDIKWARLKLNMARAVQCRTCTHCLLLCWSYF